MREREEHRQNKRNERQRRESRDKIYFFFYNTAQCNSIFRIAL